MSYPLDESAHKDVLVVVPLGTFEVYIDNSMPFLSVLHAYAHSPQILVCIDLLHVQVLTVTVV